MEVEALVAIYGEDFIELEREAFKHFQIVLVPNPGGSGENHVGFTLEVRLPPLYPNELPKFSLEDTFGLDDDQLAEVEQKVLRQAEEDLGSPMVFNLATVCKEWLDDHNVDQKEARKARMLQAEEEREALRRQGTLVTPETFEAWAKKWYASHPDKEQRKIKPTGRQLFESNADMVFSDTKFADAEPNDVAIDWSVFRDEMDDLDLDDELDDET